MPAVPLYVHRLSAGIAALEAQAGDWIDRRSLEEALGVSKWTAWRIMKQCGAQQGPGNTLVCRRAELAAQLGHLQQDGRFAPEIARRQRVEQYLDGILRQSSRQHKEVARDRAAAQLLSTRFEDLPADVELTSEELRIRFRGTADFLQKFGAVVYALQNDFEEVEEFIESRSRGVSDAAIGEN